MSYSSTFERAFQQLLIFEGGYENDPFDPGGETKYGISKRAYPTEDIYGLTVERAQFLYYRDFWEPLKCDSIQNCEVAIQLFQCATNIGRGGAVKIIQHAVNALGSSKLLEDGDLGPVTLGAINGILHPDDLLKVMRCLQLARYVEIVLDRPELKKFIRGWIRRVG